MSDKKIFTAEEVARMILEKAHNTLKKHEEMLQKSKNSSHEIDAGEEPKNDEAECPESLKGEGQPSGEKSESKKAPSSAEESEDPNMEDEPLSDGQEEDEEEEDEGEEEEEEGEENPFEFKKSESGMHTIQYKTLKKARVDEGKSDDQKKEARAERKKYLTSKYPVTARGDINRYNKEMQDSDYPKSGKKSIAKENKIINRKIHKENMKELKNIKPNLPKSEDCEYEVKKSESGMHTIEYKTLKKSDVKGVHQPRKTPTGKVVEGESEAGHKARQASSFGRMEGRKNPFRSQDVSEAKEAHKKVIEEQKKMPKPDLASSEKPEYEVKKSQSGMHSVEYKKMKKFGSQGAPLGSDLGSSIAAGIQGIKAPTPTVRKEEDSQPKENPEYHIRATQEGKKKKKNWTTGTKRHIDYSRSGMPNAKPSSIEDQKRFETEAKERAKKYKEENTKQD